MKAVSHDARSAFDLVVGRGNETEDSYSRALLLIVTLIEISKQFLVINTVESPATSMGTLFKQDFFDFPRSGNITFGLVSVLF